MKHAARVLAVVAIATSVLVVCAQGRATQAQEAQPGPPLNVRDGYVTITPAAHAGWSLYTNNADAFHFEVPPLLHYTPYGGWRSADGGMMFVRVAFASGDPAFYKTDPLLTPRHIEARTINRRSWTFWTDAGGAGYYCYRDNLALAIKIDGPFGHVDVSDIDLDLLAQIVSTFEFDDVQQRLDKRIARLKPGQTIGNRRIRRVLPAADGKVGVGQYADGILGAVDFDGSFTLTGGVVDASATHDAWNGSFGLDRASTTLLPLIGPLNYGVPLLGWDHYFQQVQIHNVPSQFKRGLDSVVVDHLRETFLPRGPVPDVTAEFVRAVGAR